MENFLNPGLIWFIIGIILLSLEFAIPGIILFFFGAGAILTAVLAWLGILNSLNAQVICFAVSSILLLVFLRRFLKQHFMGRIKGKKHDEGEMAEFIGKKAKVVKRIVPNSSGGRVKYEGTEWNADADAPIEVGKYVTITNYDNITLTVEEIKSNEKGE